MTRQRGLVGVGNGEEVTRKILTRFVYTDFFGLKLPFSGDKNGLLPSHGKFISCFYEIR